MYKELLCTILCMTQLFQSFIYCTYWPRPRHIIYLLLIRPSQLHATTSTSLDQHTLCSGTIPVRKHTCLCVYSPDEFQCWSAVFVLEGTPSFGVPALCPRPGPPYWPGARDHSHYTRPTCAHGCVEPWMTCPVLGQQLRCLSRRTGSGDREPGCGPGKDAVP